MNAFGMSAEDDDGRPLSDLTGEEWANREKFYAKMKRERKEKIYEYVEFSDPLLEGEIDTENKEN